MKTNMLLFPMVCCIPLLSCTSPQQPESKLNIKPHYSINETSNSAEAFYQLGRYYQGQQRLEQAATAYRKAVAADGAFAEAHNGLGVIYAMQGHYPDAVTEFKSAISQVPGTARFYNNLGHALYLQGNHAESVSVLEKAARLDPDNPRVKRNLELARTSANAQPAANVTMTAQPTAPVQTPPVPTTQTTSLPPESPAATPADTRPSQPETKPDTRATSLEKTRPFRLEISNGNGITGFARKMRSYLEEQGLSTARLTNQKPFRIEVSQIQYRQGYLEEALRVKSGLPSDLPVIQSTQLRHDIHARLLLGKDMTSRISEGKKAKPN